MKEDTVVSLKKPVAEAELLSSLLREGAQALLRSAVEAELATYLAGYEGERDAAGRRGIVRSGYLPARTLLTIRRDADTGAQDARPAWPRPTCYLGVVTAVHQTDDERGKRIALVVFEKGANGRPERGLGGLASPGLP